LGVGHIQLWINDTCSPEGRFGIQILGNPVGGPFSVVLLDFARRLQAIM